MGRMKPAWYYERQANEAKARATYFATRTPTASTTVKSRGAATALFYRSLFIKNGTDGFLFSTAVDNTTLGKVTAAEAGLLTTGEYSALTSAAQVSLPLRKSGIKPTKIHWYKGASTPSAKSTPWGSRVIRYYDPPTADSPSHFSMPFSKLTTPTAAEVQAAYAALFAAKKEALLGTQNGRAWIVMESTSNAIST